MGAGRKRAKSVGAAPKPAARGPRTRVPGARKAVLRKAGVAAAVVAVLGLGYALHQPVVSAVGGLFSVPARTADAAPSLPEQAAPPPVFAAASDPESSARPAGDTVAVDIRNAPRSSSGGWGSRVTVQIENASPLRDAQMPPVIPDSMTGVAKGALDLVDRALGAGQTGAKSEKIGGLLAAASDTVADMRGRVTRNGMNSEQATGKALALLEKGAAHFAAGRYIAPVGDNAYDAYREALTLDPDNAAARAGIASLREHFAKKAEGARDAKQWESANSFFEIAIAISNLRAVN